MWRLLGACLVLCCAGTVARAAVPEPGSPTLRAPIPAQPLGSALAAFETQTGLQWVSKEELTRLRSRRVRAGLAPADALRQLLKGTGLDFEFVTSTTARIFSPPKIEHPTPSAPPSPPAPPRPCGAASQQPDQDPDALPTVTVCGQRGRERADSIPFDLVVLTPEQMQDGGVKTMEGIVANVPGMGWDALSSVGAGFYTSLDARGVTDRHSVVTGAWFNDIPLPQAGSNTFARGFPFNFDLGAEVPRGPQPVLLGANTQGGAIKLVPTAPSLTERSGLAHAEWAATARGGPSYEAGAALGVPLIPEQLGFRISGWFREEGGYVDRVNPFSCGSPVDPSACQVVQRNADRGRSKSFIASLAWAPSRSVLITPLFSYESTLSRDSSAFMTYLSDPGAGELNNGSLEPQPYSDSFYLSSLKVEVNYGHAALDSTTGYVHRSASAISEDSESMRWGCWSAAPGYCQYPVSYDDAVTTHATLTQGSFTQELRLVSTDAGQRLSWVLGGFYAHIDNHETDRVQAAHIPAIGNRPLDIDGTTNKLQTRLAGFGQLTYRIHGPLMLSAGLRVERDAYDGDAVMRVFGSSAYTFDHVGTIAAPEFRLYYDSDTRGLYYFSAAKGYSPANVEAARPTCNEPPQAYPADTLWSYELGAKKSLRNGKGKERVQLDFNLFHISWDNGSVAERSCLFMHLPGRARSRGFSLAAKAILGGGFEAGMGLAYVDARYTQTLRNDGSTQFLDSGVLQPPDGTVIVRAGDANGTPPFVTAPWSSTVWVQKRFALGGDRTAELHVEDVFHSHNHGPFYTGEDPAARSYAPGLEADPANHVVNLRTQLKLGEFTAGLFIDNVFDQQPVLAKRNKGNDQGTLFYAATRRPRTVGLTATQRF